MENPFPGASFFNIKTNKPTKCLLTMFVYKTFSTLSSFPIWTCVAVVPIQFVSLGYLISLVCFISWSLPLCGSFSAGGVLWTTHCFAWWSICIHTLQENHTRVYLQVKQQIHIRFWIIAQPGLSEETNWSILSRPDISGVKMPLYTNGNIAEKVTLCCHACYIDIRMIHNEVIIICFGINLCKTTRENNTSTLILVSYHIAAIIVISS